MDELRIQRIKEYKMEWYRKNKEKAKIQRRARYLANKELELSRNAAWQRKNPEKLREIKQRWSKANPAMRAAACARRYAAKTNATPAWADEFLISEMYDLAQLRTKATGREWHVDHVVPLRSKLVCGLHCEANLRVIPGVENYDKGNRYWPDMP